MGKERRKYPRAKFPFSVKYRLAGELMELWRPGAITDISAGGLRFTGSQLIEKGAQLEFQIVLPIRKDSYVVTGQVVWGRELPASPPEYGVAFVDVSHEKQVEIDELVEFLNKGQTT